MINIHPNQGEKFYLRLLLKHKAGATSYQSLRTINDVEHTTFKAACIAMDLLESDNQWHECLQESIAFCTPVSIRMLFYNILVHCNPSEPRLLFDAYEEAMKEDFVYNRRNFNGDEINQLATNDLLCCLDSMFQGGNKCNTDFSLPPPDYDALVDSHVTIGDIDPNASDFY